MLLLINNQLSCPVLCCGIFFLEYFCSLTRRKIFQKKHSVSTLLFKTALIKDLVYRTKSAANAIWLSWPWNKNNDVFVDLIFISVRADVESLECAFEQDTRYAWSGASALQSADP